MIQSHIATPPELLAALRGPHRPMTSAEKFEQRVSFVYGQTSSIPKDQIRAALRT